ncbi:MAG: hypothetical protein A2283_22205 [Lentisphaerae bacterium RIFOXYA12_FULL_48_11]|nr:MAG: hypothetical protein A2283_22205 [Lentisphaerae bacterium RIFOXYA12_FULL_48_11]
MLLGLMVSVSFSYALGPHEVLLLVNEKSPDSVEIAAEYARIRHVPEINIVRLNLPGSNAVPPLIISPDDFSKFIWEPANKAAKDRGVKDQILVWVYSTDFPTTIKFVPEMSILGLTFLRNTFQDSEKVKMGAYVSTLFGGPDGPSGLPLSSQTFDVSKEWLREEMPLPCMMLGYTGVRGNTKDEVLKYLKNGVESDGKTPSGDVFFVTSSDIRSTCRAWQFAKAVKELNALNVSAVITNSFPVGQKQIIGLMSGTVHVKPEEGGNVYLPGCMAEHLTSMAGMFNTDSQTKLTAWLKSGVTSSSGTVTEPFSLWTKFPSARFFVHYAAGCTMIESYYQSIRCPLQILLIGDPLACPWLPKAEIVINGVEQDTVTGLLDLSAELKGAQSHAYRKYQFLLDGKVIGNDRMLKLDTANQSEGSHVIRAVAYSTGYVRNQVFTDKKIVVRKGKR